MHVLAIVQPVFVLCNADSAHRRLPEECRLLGRGDAIVADEHIGQAMQTILQFRYVKVEMEEPVAHRSRLIGCLEIVNGIQAFHSPEFAVRDLADKVAFGDGRGCSRRSDGLKHGLVYADVQRINIHLPFYHASVCREFLFAHKVPIH